MYNEIIRKITSLTLMTIMLAGGMTIAFPGFTPDAYAVNANLIVSAENTGYVAGAQVVEILVIDDDLGDDALPVVTVNGDAVLMTVAADGNYYAYIADTSEAAAVVGIINFGDDCDPVNGSQDSYCGAATAADSPVRSPISADPVGILVWPIIQTYEFPSNIEIQYNKAGGTQITTLQFDDNAGGLSLDRSIYPSGATVHVTIDDHRLNIDPTSDDAWTWNINTGDVYRNLQLDTDDAFVGTPVNAASVCADCTLEVTFNRSSGDPVIEIAGTDDGTGTGITLPSVDESAWVTVEEDGGPNTGVFTATDLDDDSIVKIAGNAPRDSAAIITYDGTDSGIIVKHSEATIEIQSPDDVWTSGLAIPIAIVDGDVNKNSQASDDVDLTNSDSIIPTLVTGDPFTLGETSSNLVTWLGWGADVVASTTLLNRDAPIDAGPLTSTYGNDDEDNTFDNPFVLKGFTADSDGTYTDGDEDTDNNAAVQENSATVDSFSERAILSFTKIVSATNDPETDVDESNTDLGDLTNVAGAVPYENVDFLVIDIENGYDELVASLIYDSEFATGYNFLNYNVESLGADVVSIDILVDRTRATTIDNLSGQSGYVAALNDLASQLPADGGDFLQLKLNFAAGGLTVEEGTDYPIVIDFFSFGFENDGEASDERIANQIIRLLLEESDDDTASLEGTLEYIMINQLNINDLATYEGLVTIDDEVSFIVIEDLTGSSAPSVIYLDVDTTGTETQVSAQQDAPSHSAVVSLDVESFKAADTVTVTLEDLDLNTNSGLPDIYTVVTTDGDVNRDAVGSASVANGGTSVELNDGSHLGRLLDITFDDERWTTQMIDRGETENPRFVDSTCTDTLQERGENTGLGATIFSMVETGDSTGIFVGTFPIPAEFCSAQGGNEPTSITGLDIEVNYVDFRDASGETTEVGDSAGVKANTGSVSLDRTVYPVPFGIVGDFKGSLSTTPSERNSETRSLFPIHQSGMSAEGDERTPGLDSGEFLPQGDLIVYVTVTDPDFDVSASGKDSIGIDGDAPVTVSVIRGSDTVTVAQVGDHDSPISEIAPDAGIFESSVTIRYNDGPASPLCPDTPIGVEVDSADYTRIIGNSGSFSTADERDAYSNAIDTYRDLVRSNLAGIDFEERVHYNTGQLSWNDFTNPYEVTPDVVPDDIIVYHDGCILQGDILQVEYNDPTDASGKPNSVTDSATFDLRNGVLQSDKSVYIIGSDMILTLIEPDFDLDSSQNETYDLDLIKWSSSAATVTMGDADGDDIASAFDPEPLSFRETGPSTGIFQIVIEIPEALDGDSLQRGEEIDLEYTDWGPSGSDYVGDQDEDIRLTVFTSNFGATIDLDQKVYSWTDKVYITIVAPDHNFDNNLIDEIGETDEDPLRVATKGFDLDNYRLVETGFDTGIFTGEVILTGFVHDPTGDGIKHIPIETAGDGPTDGYLQTPSDGGISVSYEFSDDETVFTSSIIRWNIGDVQWLEASYPASATGVLRVIDPDMNLNPEAVDNFDVNIASNTDASGITLTITETNEATGIFEGTVFFTTTGGSSGHRLRVSEGDTVTADYADGTLPLPYTTNDSVSITSTTIIGTIVPPLERAPATNLRIVDTFGSSIDAVSVDQQVQITADLSSGQDKDQDFAYLIQIQNSDGVTVSLSWIAGALSSGQSFSPSASWTPTLAGTYTVTAFVWESIDNPTALSPPLSIDISVN